MPLKQAVGLAAELSGAPRNAIYERALQLKDGEHLVGIASGGCNILSYAVAAPVRVMVPWFSIACEAFV